MRKELKAGQKTTWIFEDLGLYSDLTVTTWMSQAVDNILSLQAYGRLFNYA